jgi:hypothetical protein
MNERIKQIEEQCYIKPGGYYPGSDWPEPFFDKQQFAELILEEVMQELFINGYEDAFDFLNKHFGVEE